MTVVKDIMTRDAQCIGENDALSIAADRMSTLDVGALPICGEDGRLKGMLTDRDIVVKAVAVGLDPETTSAGSLAAGRPVTTESDASIEQLLDLMKEHRIRRVPVLENRRLVGIISQADIARHLDAADTGRTVEEISR